MKQAATTVEQYLAGLPADRRAALGAVRELFLKNLHGYQEGIQYGMIGYSVPHSTYPAGYHVDPKQPLPFAALASQKNHLAVYLMCVYGNPAEEAWFRQQWAKSGKKLDMGKSCLRFKKLEDLDLPTLAQLVKRIPARKYVSYYEAAIQAPRAGRRAPARAVPAVKASVKKVSTKASAAQRSAKARGGRTSKPGARSTARPRPSGR